MNECCVSGAREGCDAESGQRGVGGGCMTPTTHQLIIDVALRRLRARIPESRSQRQSFRFRRTEGGARRGFWKADSHSSDRFERDNTKMSRDIYPPPLSKTAKYKKITKPLLERKRRARINRCLDELKDLMVGALEIDDENMSKLEKADILELTVNHLTKIHGPKDPVLEAKKFQAGFGQCAAEACRFILALPELDTNVSQNLVNHLSRLVSTQPISIQVPNRPTYSPPISPPSPNRERERAYYSDERSSTDGEVEEASAYADRYPDDVSQYSAASNWSHPDRRVPPTPIRATPSAKDLASPVSGLLTTVDSIHNSVKQREILRPAVERPSSNNYFNRVPAECKDVILQKIRQHIMDKRFNESNVEVGSSNHRPVNEYLPRISVREDLTGSDHTRGYISNTNDTLDLRKVRTSTKPSSPQKIRCTESPPAIADQHVAALPLPTATTFPNDKIANQMPIEKKNAEQAVNLPEQLAIDYSNLPPKKKRKLLEYQEYKKQEELRRLEEIANRKRNEYFHKNGLPRREEFDANNLANQWRPW